MNPDQPQDGQQVFGAALSRLGFVQAIRDEFIQISRCTDMAMLGLLSTDQVARACKRVNQANPAAPLSTMQEQLLMSMHFWVANKQRLQQLFDLEAFTMIIMLNQAQVMRQQLEDKARSDGESTARAPNKFKTASSWKTFSEAFETYLGQLNGSGRIPLSYVIREQAAADPLAAYPTTQAQLIALAPLIGDSYNHDNARVLA